MNPFAEIRADVVAAIEAAQADGSLPAALPIDRITIEPPRDPSHGDAATNAALILAKPAGRAPMELAELLAARLRGAAQGRRGAGRQAGVRQSHPRRRLLAGADPDRAARRQRTTAPPISVEALRSMSSTARPTRPDRCMSATAGARCSATRSPTCSPGWAWRSRASTTSTTPVLRSTSWRARSGCATARRSATTSARSPRACIPATI